MTVKQFGYVAVGAILAVIAWYAPVQGLIWQIIVKGILLPLAAASGVIVAFIPIEGRPVDVMTINFIHALLSPNQYIYIKKGRKFSFTQIKYAKIQPTQNTTPNISSKTNAESEKERRLRALLASGYKDAKNSLDKKELLFLQSFSPVSSQPSAQTSQSTPLLNTKTAFSTPLAPKLPEPVIQQTAAAIPAAPAAAPIPPKIIPAPHISQPVKNIPPKTPRADDPSAAVPDSPNVIIGIVKDPRGNMLPNILVEVKDKDNVPVRAFKTNPLGQFASATALPNGDYIIELEDPKKTHAFDKMPIKAAGQIMPQIEITSHDAREELRKALFN